jgi:hypothetical protein
MLFAQVAMAAGPCPDRISCGQGAIHASAHAIDRHHEDSPWFCASQFVPAIQGPAIDPASLAPDLGPTLSVVALWPPAPRVQETLAQQDVEPFAPIPRFLSLRRLLR